MFLFLMLLININNAFWLLVVCFTRPYIKDNPKSNKNYFSIVTNLITPRASFHPAKLLSWK